MAAAPARSAARKKQLRLLIEMEKITKQTTLGELIQSYPAAVPVLLKWGLHCLGCPVSAMETIEQGALGHGLKEEEIEKLIEELNQAIKKETKKEPEEKEKAEKA